MTTATRDAQGLADAKHTLEQAILKAQENARNANRLMEKTPTDHLLYERASRDFDYWCDLNGILSEQFDALHLADLAI